MLDDEQQLIRDTAAFAAAWNRGDAKAASECYTEDCTRIGFAGDMQHSRAEIEAAYVTLLQDPNAAVKNMHEIGVVRMLAPGLAVWHTDLSVASIDGSSVRNGHVVKIMKKVGDRWFILESHPKFYPSR